MRYPRARGWATLRVQLLLLVCAVALPFAALLMWDVAQDMQEVRELGDKRLKLVADSAATQLTATLRESESMLGRLASRPMVKKMQSAPCDPVFSDFLNLHPEYITMTLRTVDAAPVCSFLPNPLSQAQVLAMSHFAQGLRHGGFNVSDGFLGRDNRWRTTLTQVVHDETGATAGLLTMSLDLRVLEQRLSATLPADVPLLVMDRNQNILLSTVDPVSWVGKPAPAALRAAAGDLREGHVTATGLDSVTRRYAITTMNATGWRVFASLPQAGVTANTAALARKIVWVGCVVLLLTVLLVWVIARRIVKPVQALSAMAARVAEGDLSARVTPSGPKEIRAVTEQFNHMARMQAARDEVEVLYKRALMLLAADAPLKNILEHVALGVETAHDMLAFCIHTVDESGAGLQLAVAPGLPDFLQEALRAAPVNAGAGCLGAAAQSKSRAVTADIGAAAADTSWHEAATRAGFAYAWSEPVSGSDGRILGVCTAFRRCASTPGAHEITAVADAAQLAALAIERKHISEDLRLVRDRLELAHRGANDGLWDWDLVTNKVYYSPRFRELLGYTSPKEFQEEFRVASHMHPEDWVRFKAAVDHNVYHGGSNVDQDYRLRCRDHVYRWFHGRGGVWRDGEGRPLRFAGTITSISERKAAEEALRQSEERFRALTQLSSDWYWEQDENFRFTAVSRERSQYPGIAAESYLGKTRWEMPNWNGSDPAFVRHREQVERHEPFQNFESRRLTRDGVFRIARISGEPVYDGEGRFKGYRGVGHDVTEVKHAEQEAQQARRRLEEVIQSASGIVWEADPESLVFTFVSQHAERLLGYPCANWLEEPAFWRDHLHPDDREHVLRQCRESAREGRVADIEYRMIAMDGSTIWLRDRIYVSQGAGEPPRLRGLMTDISARKSAEAIRRDLEAQLRESHKMEAIGTLAGGIAHDFNNFLGAILGNVALAKKDVAATSRAQVSLDEIARAGNRAKEMVQQILAFSRRQPQALLEQPLHPVVLDALSLLRATFPAGISLTRELCAGPLYIRADATQISQVLMNLCTNALHAIGAQGKGVIVVALNEVRLETARAQALALTPGRYACLSVRDNGCGMDEAMQARIFEPFFTTKAPGEGTGLGLAVVHGIIKSNAGAISVQSKLGRGSTVEVYLPVLEQLSELTSRVAPAAKPDAAVSTGNQRVMYIDDDDAMVFLVERMLGDLGYHVSGFTDSAAGLAELRANADDYDLVVTDYNMPGASGLDVAQEAARLRPGLPVLITSGNITEELQAGASVACVREVIYKPNTVDELCAAIQNALASGGTPPGG